MAAAPRSASIEAYSLPPNQALFNVTISFEESTSERVHEVFEGIVKKFEESCSSRWHLKQSSTVDKDKKIAQLYFSLETDGELDTAFASLVIINTIATNLQEKGFRIERPDPPFAHPLVSRFMKILCEKTRGSEIRAFD